MKKSQTVLIIGGGILQVPLIKEALNMNLHTVVMDKNLHAPGLKLADEKIIEDISNFQVASKKAFYFHQNYKRINAVLTVGTDFTYTINTIKKKLGLAFLSEEKIQAFSNKSKLREYLIKKKIPQPRFVLLTEKKDIPKIHQISLPLVIKPIDSMGARGVKKITFLSKKKKGLATLERKVTKAFLSALKYSRLKQVIVEEFIEGEEFSIDALIYNKKIIITGIADRIIEFPPYFIETGHIIPSIRKKEIIEQVKREFIKVVKTFNLKSGAIKGDVFFSPSKQSKKVIVNELAFRLSGGFMSTHSYPLASGVNLMKAILKINLGLSPLQIKEKKKNQVVEKAILLKNPTINTYLKEIQGLDKLKKMKQVKNIFFYSKVGDKVSKPKNNLMKIGSIIIADKNITMVKQVIKKIVKNFKINKQEIHLIKL